MMANLTVSLYIARARCMGLASIDCIAQSVIGLHYKQCLQAFSVVFKNAKEEVLPLHFLQVCLRA